jgi:hypothetical protein
MCLAPFPFPIEENPDLAGKQWRLAVPVGVDVPNHVVDAIRNLGLEEVLKVPSFRG